MSLTFLEKLEARGEAKGEAKGKQDSVLAALRAKFKRIPKHIETAIRQRSDPIALESLIYDVFESQTLDEFAKTLK
ncbi:MAG: hypothetical protein LBC02_05215 [Planctomycetaceae bacterium]|jgi:hypothetical protein|nr:hypothetical protein [Planctomycetaceae bacterium]